MFEAEVAKYPIRIVSRHVAGNVYRDYKYIVSISGNEESRPSFDHENVLYLQFDDVVRDWQGYKTARYEHISALLEFVDKKIAASPGSILVHCAQGISRSSAAAIVILNALLGIGHEEKIFRHLRNDHPFIRPNRKVLELADICLYAGGKIAESVPERMVDSSKELWVAPTEEPAAYHFYIYGIKLDRLMECKGDHDIYRYTCCRDDHCDVRHFDGVSYLVVSNTGGSMRVSPPERLFPKGLWDMYLKDFAKKMGIEAHEEPAWQKMEQSR